MSTKQWCQTWAFCAIVSMLQAFYYAFEDEEIRALVHIAFYILYMWLYNRLVKKISNVPPTN